MITKKVSDLINKIEDCPIPLEFIPNNMGINLVSVDSISWLRQKDNQLISVVIDFIPENQEYSLQDKFEVELLGLINRFASSGLRKSDLINKMNYVTKSCELS